MQPAPVLALVFSGSVELVVVVLLTPIIVLLQRWLITVNCRSEKSPRNSFEILWAIALLVAFLFFGFYQQNEFILFAPIFAFVVVILMVAAAAVDLTEYRLPDHLVIPTWIGSVIAIIAVAFSENETTRMTSALVASGAAFALLLLAHLISPRGMGFGDVKAVAAMALPIGWIAGSVESALVAMLWMFFVSFAIGSVLGGILWLRHRKSTALPFGPALVVGTIVILSVQFIGG